MPSTAPPAVSHRPEREGGQEGRARHGGPGPERRPVRGDEEDEVLAIGGKVAPAGSERSAEPLSRSDHVRRKVPGEDESHLGRAAPEHDGAPRRPRERTSSRVVGGVRGCIGVLASSLSKPRGANSTHRQDLSWASKMAATSTAAKRAARAVSACRRR